MVVKQKNIKGEISEILDYYSSDFCMFLLMFFPSATVMIDKTYTKCALLINGNLYNCNGLVTDSNNYKIANSEDLNHIRLGLGELSEYIYNEVKSKLQDENFKVSSSYVLRKNSDSLT